MDYVSVRVSTLRGDQKIDFNIYIKLAEKMVLYIRRGDSFEGERLQRLKNKNLRKLYISTDEELRYRAYLQQNIESAYDHKSSKDIQVRAEIIQGSQESQIEELFENPEDVEIYNRSKDSAAKYVQFLLGHSKAVGAVMSIVNSDQSIAHHGVNVATLAVALSYKLGVVDPKMTQLMTLGALLHDFGHYGSPLAINRPLSEMSSEEILLYNQHPLAGAQKVQSQKHFDQLVINIISQHEEKLDGSGPLQLNESQQEPLATVVASANALDRLISFESIPLEEAARKMMMESVGAHPLVHIQHLAEILKNPLG